MLTNNKNAREWINSILHYIRNYKVLNNARANINLQNVTKFRVVNVNSNPFNQSKKYALVYENELGRKARGRV